MKMERFVYWAPRKVTQPWKPRVFRGGDEWHNASVAVILPFVGGFIFFWERKFSVEGEDHFERMVPGCKVCAELSE